MKYKREFIFFAISLSCLVIGIILGYMLAMAGVFELLNHLNIENVILNFNETKAVDYMIANYV